MHIIEPTTTDGAPLAGWRKSSYSGGNQGECLEVARGYATVPVRDSKAADGPALTFSPRAGPGSSPPSSTASSPPDVRRLSSGPVTVTDLTGPLSCPIARLFKLD